MTPVLFVTPFVPGPGTAHGGGWAMGRIVGSLAERHPAGLVFLRGAGEPPLDAELAAACDLVVEVPWSEPASDRLRKMATRTRQTVAAAAGTPNWPLGLPGRRLADVVRSGGDRLCAEVVQIESPVLAAGLRRLEPARPAVVMTVHEPTAHAAREWAAAATGPRRLARALDAQAWRRWERRALDLVDAAVVFTDRDRDCLQASGTPTPVHVVPLGLDLPADPATAAGEEPPGILFVGNQGHPPNVVAARVLLEEILPAVRRRVPGTRAWVVGPDPSPATRALADPLTEVTGAVEDVTPFLERAAVVVAPLWSGGGMRVKVLEALAAGKALVATPLAVEGLGLRAGEQVVLADTPGSFAGAIAELLEDRERRAAIALAGRGWAEEHAGWPRLALRYEEIWAEALLRRATRD